MDDDTAARIGSLSDGHGLLGEVIVASGPIRLADLGDGLDIIVFTGGIGEHQPTVRCGATDGLRFLGLTVDSVRNTNASADLDISADDSPARTLVVTLREDLEIARQVRDALQ